MIGTTLSMILIALSSLSPCNNTNDNDYLSENEEGENEIDPLKATFDGDWKSPTPVTGLAVYGYVELLTEKPWYEIPLCSIKTELFIDGKSVVDSESLITYTDKSGYYNFDLSQDKFPSLYESSSHSYQIKCYAEGKTFRVGRDYLINSNDYIEMFSYTIESDKKDKKVSDGSVLLNLYINEDDYQGENDDNTYKAFSVAGAMGYAEDFMRNYENFPENPSMVYYVYPFPDNVSFTYGYIGGIGGNRWDNWKTPMHEYGHYVEWVMGTYTRTIGGFIINGVSHYSYEDLIYKAKWKPYGLKEVWEESWATILSMLVYQHYEELYDYQVMYDGDNEYISTISDLINKADSYCVTDQEYQDQCGEGQEDSVITYLWNLFDDSDEGNLGDTISFSEKEFLDLTLVDGVTTTLPNFIEYFESKYPSLIFDNGTILGACKIAPTIVSYNEDVSESIPLTINFIANGSCYNPNDKYILEFYNGSKNRLTYMSITPEINGNRGVSTYTISYSKWASIYQILKSETTVYVSIVGYLSSNPESGPYRSSLVKLPISRWPSDIIIKDPYEKYYSLTGGE